MKIKNILTIGLVCCGFAAAFTSCSKDEEAFYTVSENDSPRILNTDFPDGGFSINRDANLYFEVLVTPADYTTVKWYADGKEVYVGDTIDQAFEAGEYTLKILAVTTKGKETSRTMKLNVKPLANDPVTEDKPAERLQTPGAVAKVSGKHLSTITAVSINGTRATVTSSDDNYLEYSVPEGLADGQYRISLIDSENNSYGGGLITVTNNATVSKADFSAKSGNKLELPGCKLNDVATVTINGQDCEIQSKEEAKLTVKVPELEEGTYEIKATTMSGAAVKFLKDGNLVEAGSVKIILVPETILWEGAVNINWGDSNVFLSAEEMAKVPVGATIRLVYEITEAEYHCLRVTNQDWSSDIVAQIDGFDAYPSPYEFTYTAAHKAIADAKGMLVTGFGYKLTKVIIVEDVATDTTLWEGGVSINWGDSNVYFSAEDMAAVPVGATISLYYDIIDAEYHAMRITNQDWSSDIVAQIDGFDAYPSPYEFTYTSAHKAIADAKGMLVTGFGYKLTKVTFK